MILPKKCKCGCNIGNINTFNHKGDIYIEGIECSKCGKLHKVRQQKLREFMDNNKI